MIMGQGGDHDEYPRPEGEYLKKDKFGRVSGVFSKGGIQTSLERCGCNWMSWTYTLLLHYLCFGNISSDHLCQMGSWETTSLHFRGLHTFVKCAHEIEEVLIQHCWRLKSLTGLLVGVFESVSGCAHRGLAFLHSRKSLEIIWSNLLVL